MMNILISGVGGQGTLLASRVLGKYALLKGMDCKISEIHGMSQRGGSVTTHLRMGDKIYSPVVWEGSADMIIAFETLEAARVKYYLKPDGILLIAIYPGHEEGDKEGKEVCEYLATLDRRTHCVTQVKILNSPTSPYFMIIETKEEKK